MFFLNIIYDFKNFFLVFKKSDLRVCFYCWSMYFVGRGEEEMNEVGKDFFFLG